MAVRNRGRTSPPLQPPNWDAVVCVGHAPCLPGREGGSSHVGRQPLSSQPFPISDHMLDMQKMPVSLETGSFCMCCSELGKFALIKPPQ